MLKIGWLLGAVFLALTTASVYAQSESPQSEVRAIEVPVSEDLSPEDQQAIQDAIRTGFPNAEITVAPGAEALGLCETACNIAYAAAIEECNKLEGLAKIVCIGVADSAKEECLKLC